MLDIIAGKPSRDCAGVTRRQAMQVGTLALGGIHLAGLLSARAQASRAGLATKDTSIVLLFLTGGPSQIEIFDPKMTAPSNVRSVTGAVRSKIPGVELGGTFTNLARLTDRMALVGSFTHETSDHTKAVEQVVRGGNPINQAGMGAIAARLRGTSHPETGMPTHVYLASHEVDRQFDKERLRLLDAVGPGELGGAFGPFQLGADSQAGADMSLRIGRARLDDRLALQSALDRLNRSVDARGAIRGFDQFEQQALDLVLGKSRAAFDLSQEDPQLVERYDTGHFRTGITKERSSTLGRPVDHAVSVFLKDVGRRGLSDNILLIITGEFGRTSRVKDNGGRDHWPRLSTLALAGGGLQMGQVIGQSSTGAEEPRSDPVTLDSLFAAVAHTLFDVASLRLQSGLPREIESLLERGKPIPQLF